MFVKTLSQFIRKFVIFSLTSASSLVYSDNNRFFFFIIRNYHFAVAFKFVFVHLMFWSAHQYLYLCRHFYSCY